jgi:hypothetical protein
MIGSDKMPERRWYEDTRTIVSHEIGVSNRPTSLPTDLVETALQGVLDGRRLIGRHRHDLQGARTPSVGSEAL